MPIDYQETSKDLKTRINIHAQYGGRDIDAWMLETLQPEAGSRILDVACGSGKQLKAFHQFLDGDVQLVGVDISEELLSDARAQAEKLGASFDIRSMDFNQEFPFPDDSFDLLTCCFAIYYASDIRFTVREMHRVLKPGGRLFTTGPLPENKQLFYDIIREASGQAIPPMPGSSRYDSEILDAIKGTFASTEVHRFENPLTFPGVEPFMSYTRASLSEDRRLWKDLFKDSEEFESLMARIQSAAEARLAREGELVMSKVVGGFVAQK